MRLFSRRGEGGDELERALRSQRPVPRREFVDAVVGRVEASEPARARFGRLGLALATSGLIVIAFASFGGAGYASSAATQVVRKLEGVVRSQQATHTAAPLSAAEAQYAPFKPPAKKPTPKPVKPKPVKQTKAAHTTVTTPRPRTQKLGTTKSGGLPFTGMSLWLPALAGLVLFSLGVALRRLGRRRSAR
jgi:hypothetical protein